MANESLVKIHRVWFKAQDTRLMTEEDWGKNEGKWTSNWNGKMPQIEAADVVIISSLLSLLLSLSCHLAFYCLYYWQCHFVMSLLAFYCLYYWQCHCWHFIVPITDSVIIDFLFSLWLIGSLLAYYCLYYWECHYWHLTVSTVVTTIFQPAGQTGNQSKLPI